MWSAASCLFQEMTPPRSPEQVGFVAVLRAEQAGNAWLCAVLQTEKGGTRFLCSICCETVFL